MASCHTSTSRCFQPGFGATRKFNAIYPPDFQRGRMGIDEEWTEPFVFIPCPRSEPCECCGGIIGHNDSIVISVDGACPNNGRPNTRAAAGVYVGNNSMYNRSFLIGGQQTNQRAELKAAIAGIEQALLIRQHKIVIWPEAVEHQISVSLKMVVIKADSNYVVQGITEWVLRWQQNGYRNAQGLPVANADLFQQLDSLVIRLENFGIKVMFWLVGRAHNADADALANQALANRGEEY